MTDETRFSVESDRQPDRTFYLPDLGEGLTEAEIVAWRVAEGDEVGVDDVVVDVETAKATVEVPCPHAGRVTRLHGAAGTTIEVGAPLITVATPERAGGAPAVAPPAAAPAVADGAAGSGAVLVGYGTGNATMRRRSRSRTAPGAAPRVLSPVVRRLARDRGVDVRVLSGSGPGGVIVRRDVEAASANGAIPANVDPAVFPAQPQRASQPIPSNQSREPLRGVRRAIAEKLARSRREIPDATTWVDVDATGLMEARQALGVGVLALLGRITVAALTRFPELNASVDHDRDDLVLVRHGSVGLGFAAQTDRGLVVPVVHDAQDLSTAQLAAELARLTEAARAGALTPADLTGGTFTLNNYGVFGVDGSTPIINHPEAALLGVGRIVDKPWVVDGRLAVRKVTQLSLTFDHRVCDGGVAGGFLRYVADRVESPLGLLLDL
ncbi:dihydrolipoamide acetyltransferase family protein [Jiangella alkaliphila]|uniref:Dihydrolipoamide acetyltransferase component of pyruvate dehydrogenase complex n=1 Tax=Jiangella alkaliphila TaxID=419479 RepID=A0A1H2GTR1_9ACTN|nr:dihydrolipoamide acetyltransferase family protein [Jiangella alkaliphila]SDU23080.1 pyruvate dehydrogenase E2 component (dihydrolipoamide acetyltransferase) [Jiangella alkaliphila]